MSIRAMVWAFDQQCPSPAAKLVLLKLADHADDDGQCWPSQKIIARDCGLTRQTVNEQIQKLIGLGLMRAEQRFNGTGQQTNRYFLLCRGIGHPLSVDPTGVSAQATPPVGSADTEPSIEPSKKEDTPHTPRKRGAAIEGFEEWWKGYPRRIGRGAAEKAWPQARKLATIEELMAGRDRYAAECAARSTEAQYIKHPGPWLNSKRWLDEAATNGQAGPVEVSGPRGPPPTVEEYLAMQENQGRQH